MKRILLVEDEVNFGALLKNYLELSNYQVDWAKNGTEAYSIVMQHHYDLCILDVMMPNMDGFTLGEKIKKQRNIPFFYLTAKNQKEDIVRGYKIGADDYLNKPFDTDVLLFKINALFKRSQSQTEAITSRTKYKLGIFSFDSNSRKLKSEKEEVKLSPKEALLLHLLCQYEGRIMPREEALNQIWKQNDYFTKRSMDVYIGKLRKRLAQDQRIKIETFHQMGFQLSIAED